MTAMRSTLSTSALQRVVDGEFGIQHGVCTCKCDPLPRSRCIEKDDPFPATWICRLNDFKLDSFVLDGRSSSVNTGKLPLRNT